MARYGPALMVQVVKRKKNNSVKFINSAYGFESCQLLVSASVSAKVIGQHVDLARSIGGSTPPQDPCF